MRPTALPVPPEVQQMRTRVDAARAKAATYPPELYPFMEQFLINDTFVERSPTTEDWAYRSYQELLLDVGTLRRAPYFVPDDAVFVAAEKHECFYNAYQACITLDGYTYVEGLAQTSALVVRHAWVEDPDGMIVDPTWANHVRPIDDVTPTYYGVRFDTEFVLRRVSETGRCAILESEWRCKPDFPALRFGFETNDDGLVTGYKETA